MFDFDADEEKVDLADDDVFEVVPADEQDSTQNVSFFWFLEKMVSCLIIPCSLSNLQPGSIPSIVQNAVGKPRALH